jgi:hypothetical protein
LAIEIFSKLGRGRDFERECVQKQPAHIEEIKKNTPETLHWVTSDMKKRAN